MNNIEQARSLHKQKCNCAQAILVAFHEYLHVDPETAYKLGDGLGRGFGKKEHICGAVNAMGIVISAINAGDLSQMGLTKDFSASEVALCTDKFIDENGYMDCHSLLATNSEIRSCNDLVASCAKIINTYITERVVK
ncbi:MAG: C-GCAxxG-C-C family protein [Erysipelotrichaceae bacterium]|nr:C-GCAxxG-C-C family protein [Erysipelotrichaceae bacterium]